MTMRMIAANYIYVSGFPLTKNGYVVLEGQRIVDVVNTGGVISEFHGLEFYGGLLVEGSVMQSDIQSDMCGLSGKKILPFLDEFYATHPLTESGLAIITHAAITADISLMTFQAETKVERIFRFQQSF
ncbi:hypothetical protein FACS1894195_3080 [Bacteroidia bacterium]|nr:hypothetical protein FACS1894195_3080 [Bacteroidia bacterium]